MRREMEIYVHIPFCVQKCKYCDFLSWAGDEGSKERYVEALLKEIENTEVPRGAEVVSVFFGGGTPSVMRAEWIALILAQIKSRFLVRADAEISIEVNPGTADRDKLAAFFDMGINRLSIGLQSVHDEELKMLGRIHCYEEFVQVFEMARDEGFGNINVDLMSGLPGQSFGSWQESLKRIGALAPEHVSAYSLIVEAGTPFAEMELALPDEEEERRMYEATHEILERFGYQQYEVSNYAKEGFACEHNVGYWQRREYLGFGLGAASLVDNQRYANTEEMKEYLRDCQEPDRLRRNQESLSRKARMEEFVFLGMRMLAGVSSETFHNEFDVSMLDVFGEGIEKLTQQGLVEYDGEMLKLTRQGISVSNYVFTELLLCLDCL